jgi:hypothetical protein
MQLRVKRRWILRAVRLRLTILSKGAEVLVRAKHRWEFLSPRVLKETIYTRQLPAGKCPNLKMGRTPVLPWLEPALLDPH